MRILTLTTIYPNPQVPFEGRSVAMLDQHLAKRGVFGTTLVLKPWIPFALAKRNPKWRHVAVKPHIEESEGLRVIFSRYPHVPMRFSLEWSVRGLVVQALRLIERHKLEFEVVHGECIYPAALAAQRVAQHFHVPFVATFRDDLSHLDTLYETRQARILFEPFFRKAATIFVIGPSLYRDAPRFVPAGAGTPIVLAPNGVDLEGIRNQLHKPSTVLARDWGTFVSVSSLYRYKGIHENLYALKKLDERGMRAWRYHVLGEGHYRQELEELTRALDLADRVSFLGPVEHPVALQAMQEADFFCLPSWAEAFGNVYAEAAVCGRAAIGCRGYGAEIMIKDRETGLLVAPRDVDALAGALEFMLTHPEETRAMGARATQHIQQFTWDKTAQIYLQTLARICNVSRA